MCVYTEMWGYYTFNRNGMGEPLKSQSQSARAKLQLKMQPNVARCLKAPNITKFMGQGMVLSSKRMTEKKIRKKN